MKGYYCGRGELETEKNCYILTPQLCWLSQPFFPVLLSCLTGGLGVQLLLRQGSHSGIFSSTDLNSNCLTSCLTPGYIIVLCPLNSTPRQSRSPLISWYVRPDAPVIYTGAFLLLTAWPEQRSICNNLLKHQSFFHTQMIKQFNF